MSAFDTLSRDELSTLDGLLDHYLDLAAEQQLAWWISVRQQHPRLSGYLEKMLAPETPVTGLGANFSNKSLEPGTLLGPWRLCAWHASGGSCDVYRAERADGAFDRTVAVKLLNQWGADWQSRFLREQHLLAKLSHVNIVSLLDVGSFQQRAYFVMPWVHGQSLSEFAAAADWRARLLAAAQICDALAHAHQRLIIHRDLKPSNVVFVDGQPMILDFGIAKLLDAEADTQSTRNFFTPAYASPEQLQGAELGIACDIHAAGLLLYELLCRTPAYPKAALGLAYAVDTIVHQTPIALAANPNTAGIPKQTRRDLQAIVDCALAKAPHERYASAAQMAADLRSTRLGEPIAISKRSRWSTIRHGLAKNRLSAAIAAFALVVAGAGLLSYVHQHQRVAAERESALMQVKRLEYLREHFALILRDSASQGVSASAALDESVKNLGVLYRNQPQQHAELLMSLGELYVAAGDYLAARSALLPLMDAPTEFANLPKEIQRKALESLTIAELRLGENNAASERLSQWQSLLEANSANFAEWQLARASWLRQTLKPEAALTLQIQAVANLMQAPDAAPIAQGIALANLGTTFFQIGAFAKAKAQYQNALTHWQEYGLVRNDNVRTAEINLAHILFLQGEVETARSRYLALHQELSARGVRSPSFAALLIALARTEALLGDAQVALQQISQAREILVEKTGAQGPDALGAWLNEIDVLQQLQSQAPSAQALTHAKQLALALAAAERIALALEPVHPLRARLEIAKARSWQLGGDHAQAKATYLKALAALKNAPASLRPVQWRSYLYLAEIAVSSADFDDARRYLRGAAELVATLQSQDGLDQQEIDAWQACLDAKRANSAIPARLAEGHPRRRALAQCQRLVAGGVRDAL